MDYKLYQYENRVDLLYIDNVIRNDIRLGNSPMNRQQNIKLHKGVDNQIRFRIMNLDRKPVSVDHLSLRARLVNIETGERVLDRYANLTSVKGYAHLPIFEGDLIQIPPGFYHLVITGEEAFVPQLEIGENMQTPFFIDGAHNIVARVEVVASADPTPWPSTVLTEDNWTIKADAGEPLRYFSSAIPGARLKNHIHGVHTFAAYTTEFTGTLKVLATLELQPPDDLNDYFAVDITSGTNTVVFDNFTGVAAYSFAANFMWIRFVYTVDRSVEQNGTMDKVVVR
jgi:hypothetical protein